VGPLNDSILKEPKKDKKTAKRTRGQPTTAALVDHLGACRQTSFSTTRHPWRRTLRSASSSTALATCKQWRVCCTQHSTAASLSTWRWNSKIEYHTDTHLASYGIVLPCLEVWQLKRPVAVTYTKVDSLLIEIRERPIDVLLLCETWHDAHSVSIRRLRAEGLSVVERARPRSRQADASLAVNHGGVAVTLARNRRPLSVLPRVLRQVRRPTLSC